MGDKVLITRELSVDDPEWDAAWVPTMIGTVGKYGVIKTITPKAIKVLADGMIFAWDYPYYLLAPTPATAPRDPKVGDMVRVIATKATHKSPIPYVKKWMGPYAGSVSKVTQVDIDRTLKLDGDGGAWWWAFEWVEVVTEAPEEATTTPAILTPGMPVLVRNKDDEAWKVNIFSHVEPRAFYTFSCLTAHFSQCIPLQGNEHLLNTTTAPKEA